MTIDAVDLPPPSGPADAVRRGQASQWRLMWWQFRRHRMAMVGAAVLLLIFLVAAFCELVAPFSPIAFTPRYTYAPPQRLHLLDRDASGGLPSLAHDGPFRPQGREGHRDHGADHRPARC